MAIRDSHGVVVIYRGERGTLCPRIHIRSCRWYETALKSGKWELFPTLQAALDAGIKPCGNCLAGA